MARRLAQCMWRDRQQLDPFLRVSWEPFAVTETDGEPAVWLRRSADPPNAGVVELPRRPRYEPEIAR